MDDSGDIKSLAPIVDCPCCGLPLADAARGIRLDVACGNCGDWYRLATETSSGRTVTKVFTLRAGVAEDLVVQIDHATHTLQPLGRPWARRHAIAAKRALAVTALASLIGFGNGRPLLILLALLTWPVAYLFFDRKLRRNGAATSVERDAARARQHLLGYKKDLRKASVSPLMDALKMTIQRDRISALIERMKGLDQEHYGSRIRSLIAACDLLDEQLALNGTLWREYEKADEMVEIELEANELSGTLGSVLPSELDSKMANLRLLQESFSQLDAQLAANVEVERLLAANPDREG